MNKSASITKLAIALVKAQAEMPVVKMNVFNKFLNNKYADLGAVIETSRPILAKHELSITQFPTSEAGQLGVTSLLLHSSGEWIEDTILISAMDQKGLSVAQSAGVIISYIRRYSWASILGLYADEDNDGHTGEKKSTSPKELTLDSKVPAQKKSIPDTNPERTALVKEFSAGFNALKNKAGSKTISGNSTVDEIKGAIAHNKKLSEAGNVQ